MAREYFCLDVARRVMPGLVGLPFAFIGDVRAYFEEREVIIFL